LIEFVIIDLQAEIFMGRSLVLFIYLFISAIHISEDDHASGGCFIWHHLEMQSAEQLLV
jgi:hypothetical protein